MKGIVVFSFALRSYAEEPNPCNVRLAEVATRIAAEESGEVTIVAQWEVARALRKMGTPYTHRVAPQIEYLGSEGIWEEAKRVFQRVGIREVIPVAHPFLHLRKVQGLIARDGYTVLRRRIGRIGFDRKSTQWWTRGAVRLVLYAALQKAFGYRGRPTA